MTLAQVDGKQVEAVVLLQSDKRHRAVVRRFDAATEPANPNGAWVTEDCEPSIESGCRHKTREEILARADSIGSWQLAARLIGLLLSDIKKDEAPACGTGSW